MGRDRRVFRRDGRRCAAAATAATAAATTARDAILVARFEEMRCFRDDGVRHLLERRDVVHDVEAAAVCRDDEIAAR